MVAETVTVQARFPLDVLVHVQLCGCWTSVQVTLPLDGTAPPGPGTRTKTCGYQNIQKARVNAQIVVILVHRCIDDVYRHRLSRAARRTTNFLQVIASR